MGASRTQLCPKPVDSTLELLRAKLESTPTKSTAAFFEVLRELRARPETAQTPVVVLSAVASTLTAVERAMVQGVVRKPFDELDSLISGLSLRPLGTVLAQDDFSDPDSEIRAAAAAGALVKLRPGRPPGKSPPGPRFSFARALVTVARWPHPFPSRTRP